MLDVRHYSSDLKNLILTVCLALVVSACSSARPDLSANAVPLQSLKKPVREKVRPQVAPVSDLPASTAPVKQKSSYAGKSPEKSAWCTYLNEDAAAQSTVLLGPTVSAGTNDEGRKNAGVGYNLVNIARAKLVKDAAKIKCRRFLANSALNRMAVAAPGRLSREGFYAKAKVIKGRVRNIKAIKVLVNRELETGNFDRSQATKILLAANTLIADGERSASQAAKRQGLVAYDLHNVGQLSRQLVKAENDLADVNSNIRSAEAVAFNLDGGWREGLDRNGVRVENDSFYGGVKLSVKLGAFNPARFRHEEAAARARIRAHRYEPGGAFWKLQHLKKAHLSGRSGMLATRSALISGRVNAGRLKTNLPANDPFYLVQRYGIEIEIIRLDAEIAGVNATLRQMDKNLAKLARIGH